MSSKQTNSEFPPPELAAEIVQSILIDALERGVIDDMLDSGEPIPESAIREAIELIQYADKPALENFFEDLSEFRAQAYQPRKVKKNE